MPEPRAFGDDRIVEAAEGFVVLESAASKGWIARSEQTSTSVEHPGTAVRWGEDFWEVRGVDSVEGHVRYALAAWDERHVIRVVSEYSAPAEEERRRQAVELVAMRRKRHLTLALALLAGHLPGPVQQGLEQDFGVPASRLTIISAFPLALVGAFCAFWLIFMAFAGGMGPGSGDALKGVPSSPALLLVGAALGVESAVRLVIAFAQGRPAGSAVGAVVYEIWRRLRGAPVPGEASFVVTPELEARSLEDTYKMLEPVLSLLSPEEQIDLAERYGFDPIIWGRRNALVLLAFFGAFGYRALGLGDVLTLLVATGLSFEQVLRIVRLTRGEAAGSVLGALVRPLTRRLFAPVPPPLEPPVPPPGDSGDAA